MNWVKCDRTIAEQWRSRVLTGSLGLEGRWSEWEDGTVIKSAMNREYQYRCTEEHRFVSNI